MSRYQTTSAVPPGARQDLRCVWCDNSWDPQGFPFMQTPKRWEWHLPLGPQGPKPSFNGFDIKSPSPGNRSCDGKGTSLCQSRFRSISGDACVVVLCLKGSWSTSAPHPLKRLLDFCSLHLYISEKSTCLKFLKIGCPQNRALDSHGHGCHGPFSWSFSWRVGEIFRIFQVEP